MSAERARRYNERARPELRRFGVQYVDTHASGAAHPELSLDGVHFGHALTQQHARLFWRALCGGGEGASGTRSFSDEERHRS